MKKSIIHSMLLAFIVSLVLLAIFFAVCMLGIPCDDGGRCGILSTQSYQIAGILSYPARTLIPQVPALLGEFLTYFLIVYILSFCFELLSRLKKKYCTSNRL